MLDVYKQSTIGQYEASLRTLGRCIDDCPDGSWDAPVCNNPFCQSVFHTLFFADLYLGESPEDQRAQAFHTERPGFFRDYEELVDKKPGNLYAKADINEYLQFCVQKARDVVNASTEEWLAGETGIPWQTFSRAEMHVYNIRHIHHHVAQLSLRLRIDHGIDIRWVKSGW